MKPLFDSPLAIVDLETTGAHPAWDRVTEIAVVEVAELLQGHSRPRFDLDHYKILAPHLGAGRTRVVELGTALH